MPTKSAHVFPHGEYCTNLHSQRNQIEMFHHGYAPSRQALHGLVRAFTSTLSHGILIPFIPTHFMIFQGEWEVGLSNAFLETCS